jgi:hypothetical protein
MFMLQSYDSLAISGANLRQSGSFAQALRETAVIAALLGAVSLLLFFLNTRHGIGVLPDTTRYMGINDLPYDAPIYAWVFSVLGNLGLGLTAIATMVAIIVLIVNVVLLATLLFRITGRTIYVVAGSALVLFSPQFVTLHSVAMSEPPFLMFLLLTLHLSLTFMQTEDRYWLALSGVSLGLATLTRFTAPPLGAALALAYLLNSYYPFKRRLADATLLFAVSSAIFFAWVLANQLAGDQSIGRDLSFFGTMGQREWFKSFNAMAAWLLPDDVPKIIRHLTLLAVLGTFAYLAWQQARRTLRDFSTNKSGAGLLLIVLSFFFLFYVAFVFLASAIEANLHLNGRYGFPAYVALVILAAGLVARYHSVRGPPKIFTIGLTVFALLILASHATRTAVRTYDAFRNGIGYNDLEWKLSPTIAGIHRLPGNSIIYSNGADAIAYIVDRPSHFIPHERLLRTNLPDLANPLPQQIAAMRNRAETQSVYVVYFDEVWWRPYLVDEQKLKAELGMELIDSLADGRIYKVPEDANVAPASPVTKPEDAQ